MEELTLKDHIQILKKNRKPFLISIGLFGIISALFLKFFFPNLYRVQAKILPDESSMQRFGGANVGSALNLEGVLGRGLAKPNNDIIVAILKSRDLARQVVEKNNLIPFLIPEKVITKNSKEFLLQLATSKLLKKMTIAAKKNEGIIHLSVYTKSSKVSYDIIGSYLDQLQEFIAHKNFSSSKRKRLFIEEQLLKQKQSFLTNGKFFNSFYGKNNVSSAAGSINVTLSKEGDMPVKNGQPLSDSIHGVVVPNVPHQIFYDYLSSQLQISNNITSVLAQQLEMAKVDEARDELVFKVIDSPEMPIKANFVSKVLLFIVLNISWLFISLFFVFTAHAYSNIRTTLKD